MLKILEHLNVVINDKCDMFVLSDNVLLLVRRVRLLERYFATFTFNYFEVFNVKCGNKNK